MENQISVVTLKIICELLEEKSARDKLQANFWETKQSATSETIQFYLGKAEAFQDAANILKILIKGESRADKNQK